MLGIVFPLLLVDVRLVEGFAVVDVHVVVVLVAAAAPAPSPSVVVVDVHLVTAPVAAARDRGADRHAGTERQQTRGRDVAGRVRVHRRIGGRVGGRAVDRLRDVRRHVDDLRIGRDDLDDLLLDHHLLLLRRLELAGLVGLPPHALDGIEHVRLLSEEDVPQLRGPVEVLRHPTEHVGEVRERLDARVPGLRLERFVELLPAQLRTFLDPALGLHDLERVGRGHQDLHEKRIGVERDRGHQLVEPLGGGPFGAGAVPAGGGCSSAARAGSARTPATSRIAARPGRFAGADFDVFIRRPPPSVCRGPWRNRRPHGRNSTAVLSTGAEVVSIGRRSNAWSPRIPATPGRVVVADVAIPLAFQLDGHRQRREGEIARQLSSLTPGAFRDVLRRLGL